MSKAKIGVQMYTVREHTQTPEDYLKALEKIKAIGYDGVQGGINDREHAEQMAKTLKRIGLAAAGAWVGLERMKNEPAEVAKDLKLVGTSHTSMPGVPEDQRSAEGYSRFAKEMSEVGRQMKEHGATLSYHNHAFELQKYGGRTGLEILRDDSDAGAFCLMLDTYWVQKGGGDPAAWIRSVKGRIPVVHLKDMKAVDNDGTFCEVGEGNLNWPEILKACKEAGVEWYVVEQDECDNDPFESLKISVENLRSMGL